MFRSVVGAAGKAGKMASTSGTQTVIMYPKSMGGYIIDLLEKLNEIKSLFGNIKEEIHTGQEQLDRSENNVDNMEVSINNLSSTMDTLGSRMLKNNVSVAQRSLQIQTVKQEIRTKKEHLRKLLDQLDHHTLSQQEQAIIVLTKERDILEQRLVRINHDIEQVYEEMFETQERLLALKDRRMTLNDEEDLALVALRDQSSAARQRKERILSLTEPGQALNMQDLYISPAKLRQMQTEIEELKHKQILFERHIQAQLEEREFLRDTAEEIVKKVYNLEKVVRKEKGDHNPESPLTVHPVWRRDLGGPKIWYQPPSFTVEQLKRLMAEEYQKHPATKIWTEEPGTSGFGDETIKNKISFEAT